MQKPHKHSSSHRPAAFTLVELLVVIGIIALLVGILMPSLSKARRQAQEVVCRSNLRQVTMAMLSYSLAHKGALPGAYWQGAKNLDWAGRRNAVYLANPGAWKHPLDTSVLKRYMVTDNVLTCPTGERANHFFDYTMIIRFAGVKSNCRFKVSYPVKPALANSPRQFFDGLPLLVEESDLFYNVGVNDDGSFANADQLTARHKGRCNIAYADGSVSGFTSPRGKRDTVAEPEDLTSNHLLLHANTKTFPISYSDPTEFGWANKPK